MFTMHREDVVAAIRKRFGSVAQFERERGFPPKSVNEVLRGRKNKRVAEAIDEVLKASATSALLPEGSGSSPAGEAFHRLNEGER